MLSVMVRSTARIKPSLQGIEYIVYFARVEIIMSFSRLLTVVCYFTVYFICSSLVSRLCVEWKIQRSDRQVKCGVSSITDDRRRQQHWRTAAVPDWGTCY